MKYLDFFYKTDSSLPTSGRRVVQSDSNKIFRKFQRSIDLEKKMERKVNKELNDATFEGIDINPTFFEVPKDIDIK